MSSSQSGDCSSRTRRSYSTPLISTHKEQNIKHSRKEKNIKRSLSYEVSSCGDSTRSLLSPIYHSSFEDDEDDTLDSSTIGSDFKENVHIRAGTPSSNENQKPQDDQSTPDNDLTAWEAWLVSKERLERVQLQTKILEELKQNRELLKIKQHQKLHKMAAEEMHRDWVRKKNEQEKKEKELKLLKEQKRKEAKERQKAELEEKAKEKFNDWLKKKQMEEKEKKRTEKEEEERRLAQINEKKERAKMTFEEWLENAKSKPRPVSSSYAYANGRLTGYYDSSASPAPGFCNPVPWKPINVPPPKKETLRKNSGKPSKRMPMVSYRTFGRNLTRPKDNLCISSVGKK